MGNKIKNILESSLLYLLSMNVVNLLTSLASCRNRRVPARALSGHFMNTVEGPSSSTEQLSLDLDVQSLDNCRGDKRFISYY